MDYTIDDMDKISGARILLVEDNDMHRKVATDLLEEAGFIVNAAKNGREAVEILTESNELDHYDLVLMDIQMPEMDGYTATETIRRLDSNIKDIPIIALTALTTVKAKEKCLATGMNDHIAKPIDPGVLFSILVKWIQPGNREILEKAVKKSKDPLTIVLPDKLPGLDIKTGLIRLANNKSLYLEMLFIFEKQHGSAPDEIARMLNKSDFDQVNSLAHAIKGEAGILGADDLFKAASEIENASVNENKEKLESLLEKFISCTNQLLMVIDELKEKVLETDEEFFRSLRIDPDENEDQRISDDELISLMMDIPEKLLNGLKDAVELGDRKLHEKMNSEIRRYNGPVADRLETMFIEFKYERILELIRNLENI